jgi:hypothetical protein
LAANYLRSAVETIADRTRQGGKKLPAKAMKKFILDRSQNARARRLAFVLLTVDDPSLPDQLIPGMLLDPSPEFRRDAVARLIESAKQLEEQRNQKQALSVYRQALAGATDADQVKEIVKPLTAAGQKIDLQKHFGFLTNWQIIGPFDNRELVGFDVVYPPEKKIDLAASFDGQIGPVSWVKFSTNDDFGLVNIGKDIKNYKGSCMYATATFHSSKKLSVEFKLGTPNAWKLWLNGKLLFGRAEYHRGERMDQYQVPAVLQSGKNTILFKICQNEQTQDWAQKYQFQIRVCDPTGVAVLSEKRISTSQR